jgi:hypothetical protein
VRRALAFVLCACGASPPPVTAHATTSHVVVPRSEEEEELVIPFYEGVRVPRRDAPMLEIPYPGVLATPMIIFGAGDDWTAVYAPLDALGLIFRMRDGRIELSCPHACKLETVHGASWEEVAHAVAKAYDVHAQPPLATRYTSQNFYVRDWISTEGEPRRTAWTRDALRARLDREPPDVIEHVYGIDPGGVDLAATYFREPAARAEAEAMIREHPWLSFFSWLNLRTYKYAIPATKTLGVGPDVEAMAWRGKDGAMAESNQYVFESVVMCSASAEWQASRMRELEKLVGLGFKVVAMDEFPLSATWDTHGCTSTHHLHRAGDLEDESRITRDFVAKLSDYARAHGVLLSEEEPSAAFLPFISGYVDRIANPPAMYEIWQKVPNASVVPLFSTMFGALVTPYTDPSPTKPVPSGWITTKTPSQ